MLIYQTDINGLWDGSSREARPDPVDEGRYLIPAGCVTIEPPPPGDRQVARFRAGAWELVADWRGHTYWTADRIQHLINEVGIEPPADALDADPGPTAAELWAAHQASAQAALDFNDRVAIRCLKAGVSYPAEWRNHDNALRAILRAASGDPTLPTPPHPAEFPAGT